MNTIDIDPELLHRSADAALHAMAETYVHIDAEIDGRIPQLMDTLVPDGPYAYTIQPEINADGTVRSPILTTREGIHDAYVVIRGASALLSVEPLVEIRGLWYTFQEGVSIGQPKGGEPTGGTTTLAIFPVSSGKGITGELVWPYVPRAMLGRGEAPPAAPTDPLRIRRDLIALHDRFLDAFRSGNVDSMLDTLNDDVQGAVRDYVNDTGTLIELRGKEEHRAFYGALFERYEIRSVELLDRVAQDWYVFAEFRVTASPHGADAPIAFHIAEYAVTAKDGRFMVHIGHGTDPA
jgi:hypothetical protein